MSTFSELIETITENKSSIIKKVEENSRHMEQLTKKIYQ